MGYISDIRQKVGHDPVFMPGAGVFFIDPEGRALLQRRRDNGLWAGTGGALEMGETFEEAAKRETQEELGLLPVQMEVLNVYSGPEQHYVYPNKDEVYVVSVQYICKDYSGTLTVDMEECMEADFFSLSDFPDMANVHPPDRPMVADLIQWMQRNTCESSGIASR